MKNFSRFEVPAFVPIGVVRSSRVEPSDDGWDAETSAIELDDSVFGLDALSGLKEFSHVEVVFYMHRTDPARMERGARHPRGNSAWPKVGIFAQRAKDRPNAIGTTVCEVLGVEAGVVRVRGLDAIEGTPVLDIKPWLREFGPRGELRQPAWATELMRGYW
jgi:tRNA-Thr(GGU) m(6)t(6)A37 methyltransferase TsaA